MKVCKICNTENQDNEEICCYCGCYLGFSKFNKMLLIGIFIWPVLIYALYLAIKDNIRMEEIRKKNNINLKELIFNKNDNTNTVETVPTSQNKKQKFWQTPWFTCTNFSRNKKTILIIVFLILGLILLNSEDTPQEQSKEQMQAVSHSSPGTITKEMYGDDYPYTVDNLILKCENDAVWVVDEAGNIYALNGLADGKFKGKSNYKGYTMPDNILIEGKSDGNIQSKGFELCK